MSLVYGFGGMRDYDGHLSFDPRLPEPWQQLRFPLTIQGQVLDVEVAKETVTYRLREGSNLVIRHQDEEVSLTVGVAVTKSIG